MQLTESQRLPYRLDQDWRKPAIESLGGFIAHGPGDERGVRPEDDDAARGVELLLDWRFAACELSESQRLPYRLNQDRHEPAIEPLGGFIAHELRVERGVRPEHDDAARGVELVLDVGVEVVPWGICRSHHTDQP